MDISPRGVVCKEIFDENSQPSAEEISEYALQIGIDPDSEGHLLPLAKDGLMKALPPPWKVYYNEVKLAHYYYNEETKQSQWEHPLDNVYRDLVKKARDASIHDDTCASIQELPTSEEHPKQIEVKNDSDDECLLTDSDVYSDTKDKRGPRHATSRILTPLGRPPRVPTIRALEKGLSDLRISPLRKSIDGTFKSSQNEAVTDTHYPERTKKSKLLKQKSEIIDLKIHVLDSPEEKSFNLITSSSKDKVKSLTLTGNGEMFMKDKKADLQSHDSQKSFTREPGTNTDMPKGILRETVPSVDNEITEFPLQSTESIEDDKKSVRFQLQKQLRESTVSPSSNSSSDQCEGASSIISAPPSIPPFSSLILNRAPLMSPSVPSLPTFKNNVPNYPKKLAPLSIRPPPLQMEKADSCAQVVSDAPNKESSENIEQLSPSPKRRVLRPPAADYIKPDLFMKSFQKISDMVKPEDNGDCSASIEEPPPVPDKNKEKRPMSPMIPPQKAKISINLMESIDSDSSMDSPDKEVQSLHLEDNMELLEKSEESDIRSNNSDKVFSSRIDGSGSFNVVPIKPIPKTLEESRKYAKEMTGTIFPDFPTVDKEDVAIKTSPRIATPFNFKLDQRLTKTDCPTRPGWPSYNPLAKSNLKSDATASKGKGLGGTKIDGVIISQGKSFNKDPDDVVVMFQFEPPPQEENKKAFNSAHKEAVDKIKSEEKNRLQALLQRELEDIRAKFAIQERQMREKAMEDVCELKEKLEEESKRIIKELSEEHREKLAQHNLKQEQIYSEGLRTMALQSEERYRIKCETINKECSESLIKIKQEQEKKLAEEKKAIELENERTLRELREQSADQFEMEKARIIEESQLVLFKLRDEHISKVEDQRDDYRVEVDRLRNQHACHLEEMRARLASERAAGAKRAVSENEALADKYKCLKEKYARLKRDVRLSMERRSRRREMSATTGSETEKSNSNKGNKSLEKCKEANEPSVSGVSKGGLTPSRPNLANANKVTTKNGLETSQSDSQANRSTDTTNLALKGKPIDASASGAKPRPVKINRRNLLFREPQKKRLDKTSERDPGNSDVQDSSEAEATTSVDNKPKKPIMGARRQSRRSFNRLKSASTSRLNYSPVREEGWAGPLEALRQQLRKLDDLEDEFPDITEQNCLRYPFAELGVGTMDTPELGFVRHRALIEREGLRRARSDLRKRKAAFKKTRVASTEPTAQPWEDKDITELEIAFHRARSLLNEKDIRLRHIERILDRIADSHHAKNEQDEAESDSSESETEGVTEGEGVLRSLRHLHDDVRDIWRAIEARPSLICSPENSSHVVAPPAPPAPRRLSEACPLARRTGEESVSVRARGIRAWLRNASASAAPTASSP